MTFIYDLILQKRQENVRLLLSKTINYKTIINNKIIKSMKSFRKIISIKNRILVYVSMMI